MKKLTLATLALAALTFSAGTVLAADTADLIVTAEVLPACSFDAANTTLAFGALDGSLGTDIAAPAPAVITYKCTVGTTPLSITVPGGGTMNSGSTGGTLAYALTPTDTWTAATSTGSLSVAGLVTNAAIMLAPAAADYTDTQTLTINY